MDKVNKSVLHILWALAFLITSLFPIKYAIAEDCMEMEWRRGKPYDYYSAETRLSTGTFNGGLLYLVENAHLTNDVKSLRKGSTGKQPGDLLYVLGSIPNHPVALDAYARFEHKWKESPLFRESNNTSEPLYKAECFFQRAAMLYPSDASTYLTWGIHYHRLKEYRNSLDKFLIAYNIAPESAEVNYNVGLAYLEVKNIEKAKEFAARAYQLGYPLNGLKNKIARFKASN